MKLYLLISFIIKDKVFSQIFKTTRKQTKLDYQCSEDKGYSLTVGRCRTSVVFPAHGVHPSR